MIKKSIGAVPDVLKVGTNEMELIVFKMLTSLPEGGVETRYYGVNVAKVREIIPMPTLTTVPDMPDYADAMAEVRGDVIPIIYLDKLMKLTSTTNAAIRQKIIVLEMLRTTVGIVVHDVERIRRIRWDQIKPPPLLFQAKHGGKLTGVVKMDDQGNSLLLILDFESLISDIGALIPKLGVYDFTEIEGLKKKHLKGNVLIVDDSFVARKILKDTLESVGLHVIEAVDGKQAFEILKDFLGKIENKPITDFIQLIISDVEMPEMDGLTFTKNIKADQQLKALPLIINTSLSGDENKEKAKLVGADGYLVKFDISNLLQEVSRFLK